MTKKLQIAVLDRAWVYLGMVEKTAGAIVLSEARNIRRWGTSKGLGQLAAEGPQDATVLDDYGTVTVPDHAVMHMIAVTNAAAWSKHFPASQPSVEAA
jgi:hypothetical protein